MKKHIIKFVLFSFCCTFLVSCSNQTQKSSSLSSKDEELIWSGKREKVFGQYDYTHLTSEDEAKKIAIEKFDVSIPSFYKKVQQLLNENDFLNSYEQHQTTYDVVANGDTLIYRQTTEYGSETVNVVRSVIEITYKVTGEKQVKTEEQTVKLSTVASEIETFYNALPNLSEKMASIIQLSNPTKELEKAFEEYPVHDEQRHIEAVNLLSQKATGNSLSKNIQLFYDGEGTVTEWYTAVLYE